MPTIRRPYVPAPHRRPHGGRQGVDQDAPFNPTPDGTPQAPRGRRAPESVLRELRNALDVRPGHLQVLADL